MEKNKYIIGSHGCQPNFKYKNTWFKLPNNITIILFNGVGLSSNGYRNIPFIKYLVDLMPNMANYIFDITNYEINLDKNNVRSYRHPNFFTKIPFYSKFNNLCNMEIYPAGHNCPNISLSFTKNSNKDVAYFEGITALQNIKKADHHSITFHNDDEVVKINDQNIEKYNIKNKYSDYFIDLDQIIQAHNDTDTDQRIYFVSACRVQYYNTCSTDNHMEYLKLDPIEKNCRNFNDYDISKMDKQINEFNIDLIKGCGDKEDNIIHAKNNIIVEHDKHIKYNEMIVKKFNQNKNFYNYKEIDQMLYLIYGKFTDTFIDYKIVNLSNKLNYMAANSICKYEENLYTYRVYNFIDNISEEIDMKIRLRLIIKVLQKYYNSQEENCDISLELYKNIYGKCAEFNLKKTIDDYSTRIFDNIMGNTHKRNLEEKKDGTPNKRTKKFINNKLFYPKYAKYYQKYNTLKKN